MHFSNTSWSILIIMYLKFSCNDLSAAIIIFMLLYVGTLKVIWYTLHINVCSNKSSTSVQYYAGTKNHPRHCTKTKCHINVCFIWTVILKPVSFSSRYIFQDLVKRNRLFVVLHKSLNIIILEKLFSITF